MRTKVISLFTLDELDNEARKRAYDAWLQCYSYPWFDENRQVLKAFENVFPVRIREYNYGDCGSAVVRFEMTCDEEVESLTGQRLATYIWNNYKPALYKGKYYSTKGKANADGKYTYQFRHSRVILSTDCVLTGFWLDNEILGPIYDFLRKPDARNFSKLMEDCFYSWLWACCHDLEESMTFEAFESEADANEWEFDEQGNLI